MAQPVQCIENVFEGGKNSNRYKKIEIGTIKILKILKPLDLHTAYWNNTNFSRAEVEK